ncbi:unnamed protein product [Linum trigynum]|uniref:Uncharacterized protein n=1 Tax=Linum trigynum TaxID=586398 RepID=A0AAV2EKI3_9ROSI
MELQSPRIAAVLDEDHYNNATPVESPAARQRRRNVDRVGGRRTGWLEPMMIDWSLLVEGRSKEGSGNGRKRRPPSPLSFVSGENDDEG